MRPDSRHETGRIRPAAPHRAPTRLPSHPAQPPRLSADACERARQLHRQGRFTAALSEVEAILADATRPPGPGAPTLQAAALQKAWCLIELKRHADAATWLIRARRHGFVDDDDPDLAVLEMNLALFDGAYEDVRERAERMLSQASDSANRLHAELRLLLGAALRWQGRLTEAVGHVEFACSAFTVLNEPGRTAVAANFLGWTCLSLGRLDDSRRWFEKALDINSQLGARLRMAQNYQNLSIVCYKQGDYELAVELLEKELSLVEGLPDMTCRAMLALGHVRRLQGETVPARTLLLDAFSMAREHGLAREEALALEFLGDVQRDESRPAAAREFYRQAMTAARRIAPRGDLVMELLRREGECLDLEGRHADANRVLNEAAILASEVGDRFEAAVIRRCLGQNAAHLGRWGQAQRDLSRAHEDLRDLTARHETMIAAYHLARVLARQGKTGSGPASQDKAVTAAWRCALQAQQLHQELETPHLADEISGLVTGLARRRLQGHGERPLWQVFSTRRAPASRVVAVSPVMQSVLRRSDGYARYDHPVLLTGEAGTGKELLARRIHENSPRGARPFVPVNCASTVPSDLVHELFGLASSLGPAARPRPGLVARAEGGTLLLIGIEELPRSVQGRLLRLIREGVYSASGDGQEKAADVRVMATTEVDLSERVDRERFRPDLYFRMRLMTIGVPALRDRRRDVIPMLEHFLSRLAGSTLAARSVFDPDALMAFGEHSWPGNATELEAVAQQAWTLHELGQSVTVRLRQTSAGTVLEFPEAVDGPAGTDHASGMTWASLTAVIDRTGGNKAKAARNLGVSRMTLYRWLKQLDPTVS